MVAHPPTRSTAPPAAAAVWVAGARVFTGTGYLERTAVGIAGGRIAALLPEAQLPDGAEVIARADLVAPGFIDLQVNGAGGVLFNDDPTAATLATIAAAVRATGCAYLMPTLISAAPETMRAAAAAVDDAVDDAVTGGIAGILGLHLEGPWLNAARRGAHDARRIRRLAAGDAEGLATVRRGATLVTLAPETAPPGAVRALAARGVRVFAGHTEATYDECRRAAADGLTGFTHAFNAMPPPVAREPGAAGAALALDDAFVTVIADGHHVHPEMLKTVVRAKPPGRTVLVTDAMPTLGAAIDGFDLDGRRITLRDGRLTDDAGGLAGAHLRLDEAVRNIRAFAGIDEAGALRMASTSPAHALGLENELGSIAVGMRAGLTLLSDAGVAVAAMTDGELIAAVPSA